MGKTTERIDSIFGENLIINEKKKTHTRLNIKYSQQPYTLLNSIIVLFNATPVEMVH